MRKTNVLSLGTPGRGEKIDAISLLSSFPGVPALSARAISFSLCPRGQIDFFEVMT
jgi:hypothetical protein